MRPAPPSSVVSVITLRKLSALTKESVTVRPVCAHASLAMKDLLANVQHAPMTALVMELAVPTKTLLMTSLLPNQHKPLVGLIHSTHSSTNMSPHMLEHGIVACTLVANVMLDTVVQIAHSWSALHLKTHW